MIAASAADPPVAILLCVCGRDDGPTCRRRRATNQNRQRTDGFVAARATRRGRAVRSGVFFVWRGAGGPGGAYDERVRRESSGTVLASIGGGSCDDQRPTELLFTQRHAAIGGRRHEACAAGSARH